MIKIVTLALLILCSMAFRIFYIGGAVNQHSSLIFNALANVVKNRSPQPKFCSDDWATTKCPRIAVVTSAASSELDGNDAYSNDSQSMSYKTLFWTYGMSPKHITLHRDNFRIHANTSTPQGKLNLEIVNTADIIFFNGGDQSRHVRSWLLDDASPSSLLLALKNRAMSNEIVCSGTSAGSMIWDTQTFGEGNAFGVLYFMKSIGLAPKKLSDAEVGGSGFLDDRKGNNSLQYNYNGGKMPAFGFVNFTVDTHFNARGRLGRLAPVLTDLKKSLGIGIDQNTAFFYDDRVCTVFGYNGVTITDLSHSQIGQLSYFSISNVTGHYLTAGDIYHLSINYVISSKTLITTPAYNGPTDSNDILAAYEASLLQTRLVDQKSLYNLGRTKRPSAFPAQTPTFQIKFYRSQSTKGYYSNNNYTATHIVYDYSYGSNIQNLSTM